MHRAVALITLLIACDSNDPGPSATTSTPDATVATTVDVTPIDTSGGGRALTRNDVSVLFPMGLDLWKPSDPALGGVLLPRASFDLIGRSLMTSVETEAEYDALRVIAIRFDHCFRIAHDAACQPQIRVVFQGVDESGALDGAVHAFYNVSDAMLPTFVAELRAIGSLAPENVAEAPLSVSPALAAQGVDGAYGNALRTLLATRAGQANLARMTFMTRTDTRSGQWEFGGFHIGAWSGFPDAGPLGIFGAFATQQTVTRRMGAQGFEYTVEPTFALDAGLPTTNAAELVALDAEARAGVHAWAVRQEDPAAELADTSDCASCHLAGRAAGFLEELEPSLLTPALQAVRAPRAVGEAEKNADNLRAFGWFADWPQVSQRVANETEVVVAAMNGI